MFTKKTLVIGNNDQDTHDQTSALAHASSTVNHGLITSADFYPTQPGYYHTTVLDLDIGGVVNVGERFDQIILLDQPVTQWSNWKVLLSSFKTMLNLELKGKDTVFRQNANVKRLLFWKNTIDDKKGFCIYPWILLTDENGYTSSCLRSSVKITDTDKLVHWQTDLEYQKVRQKFLSGQRAEYKRCRYCYELEDKGIESPREFESMDWLANLAVEDDVRALDNITAPLMYEIRLDNRCNLACRHCDPGYSTLVAAQWKTVNITWDTKRHFSSFDIIRIEDITPKTRIYLTGGEVTVMPEFQEFLKKCIDRGITDFDFSVGSNGFKIPEKIWDLCDHFPRMVWSISLDGYGKINDYIRWPSRFETIIENCHKLQQRGHIVSINHVPSILNITSLHLLFEFLDRELPDCNVYTQINYYQHQSVYNHPDHELAVASLERLIKTNAYYKDGRGTKSTFDALLEHYRSKPEVNKADLRKFFEINDKIDLVQGKRLADYVPDLDACRYLVQ
jgi:MoaA/NifB/PqqE/SkfB family radical SAM enzyme